MSKEKKRRERRARREEYLSEAHTLSLLVFFPMINDLNAGGSLWRFWEKRIPH